MKTPTLPRVGRERIAARWLGFLATAVLLLGIARLDAQSSQTATTVTTLGGGPQSYNTSSSYGYSNSVWGALESQFHTPSGLALDNGLGLLYVADRDNNAVRYLDLVSGQSYTLAPYPPYIPTNLISQPVGVAVDALGNVYVLNRGNGHNGTVVEIDYYGDYITNTIGLTNANGIALDTVGNIYVTASNTVVRISPDGTSNVVAAITAPGALLQGIVVKRGGPKAGWLAVCDSGRNGIYLINPTNGVVTTNAGFNGMGDGTGLNNRGVANAQAQFFQPSGLAEAGDGSLIVADFGNNRVKVVEASGYTTNLYGVASNLWWSGTTGSGGTAWPGWSDGAVWQPDTVGDVQARQPFGVAIGSDGTIYTTEDYYHLIRQVTGANIQAPPPWPPPAPATLGATAGYGQVALAWSPSPGATNYNVKRSTSSGSETTIASTAGASYTDTNLLDGTTYYYVVSALNTGGEGQNSTEVSATPQFSPAPTNLTVTATNFGLISLAWSPSAGATGYNLARSTSTGGPYTVLANVAAISYNDTNVTDGTTYYYVVRAVNPGGENPINSPEVSVTAPIRPPPSPQIGWYDYEGSSFTGFFSKLYPVSGAQFISYNDLNLAVDPNLGGIHSGVSTYYTDDGTTPSPSNGSTPPPYADGMVSVTPLPVTKAPDLIIKAVNVGPGGSSAVVAAEFIFQVGSPIILGNNAAQFIVTNITTGAQMYYTTDGSDPTNDGSGTSIGPISSGQSLSLNFGSNTNLLVKIRGFKADYEPSTIVSNVFSSSSFVPNSISFGFASGEASSDFVAAPGQTFYAPVTLTTLPSTVIYSLQFNVTVNPGGPNPGPDLSYPPTPFGFMSMLMKPIPGSKPVIFEPIPPAMFAGYQSVQNPVYLDGTTNFSSLLFTNNSMNLLGVGWAERYGNTNLYDTTKQTLLTYSMAHDDMFPNDSAPSKVVVGGYAFTVPGNATNGQTYQIQIGRPSATSDGIGAPGSSVFIAAPTNGSLTAGAINAIKDVTVGSRSYLVGNVYPFHWFNAGDFGNTNLQNADVEQVFEAAVYNLNSPAFQAPGSDFFDAMDSCGNFGAPDGAGVYHQTTFYSPANPFETNDANYTAIFSGNDSTINQIAFGDGVLDVCDVYVTFRRSLDTNSLVWFQRFWTNGVRVATASYAPGIIASGAKSGGKVLPAYNSNPSAVSITNIPSVDFTAGDFQAAAGQTVQIPVSASVFGPYPLRVALLNVSVVPLDGSPALATPVSFSPTAALGTPYMTDSDGPGNYAAAWLNSTIAGISNNGTVGTLTITIPANATSLSAYAVHFDRASGSPNGLASFPEHAFTGLITLSSRTNSTYNDGIPDSWRLRWFGTVNNLLSVSNACPSGDGVNNWQKYVAGVDPNTPNDFPSLTPNTPPAGAAMSAYWPTVSGKHYAILSSASLFPGNWTTNAIVTGNGANMQFNDNAAGPTKFYRVLILP